MSKDRQEDGVQVIASVIVLLVVILFTYFGFFYPQECHPIDKEFLWCRLHPFTVVDLIGCILFYAGAAVLAGVTKLFGYDPVAVDGSWRTWATAGALVLGIVLIWAN